MSVPYDKNNPFPACLVERRRLSAPNGQKETSHFSVSLKGSGLTYTCGDSLGVFPTNNPKAVDAFLKAARLTGDESVLIPKDTAPVTLREAVTRRLALNGPTYKFVQLLHDRATDPAQKAALAALSPEQVTSKELAGEPITRVLTRAPGNDAPIGGLKVESASAWFAARPSGTEDVYKIYAESFRGPEHLAEVQQAARAVVDSALGST